MIVSRKFKRIKITANTPIAKPGNGHISGGKINNLLLLSNGAEAEKDGKKYLLKGLRGLLNHSMMAQAKQKGIEVCHSSNKEETQSGEKLLPEGFHPNGGCYPENGSINKQSVLRFEPVVIVSASANSKSTTAQKMHIATERRNSLVQGSKKAIQDFGERYVSGEFTLIIELLKEITQEELGFLLHSILYMPELGFGGSVNNGSGKIILEEVAMQEVERTRTIKKGKVIEEEKERNLWKEMEEAMNTW
ncbi:MAG: hypothetical protein ACTSQX_13260 [Candidatus Heimdallarchaeota archaeon]